MWSNATRRLIALAASALAWSWSASSDETGFRLLQIDGKTVSWRSRQSGDPLVLSVALLRDRLDFSGIGRCRRLQPIDRMLDVAGIEAETFNKAALAALGRWQAAAAVSFVLVSDPSHADIVIGSEAGVSDPAYTSLALAPPTDGNSIDIERAAICLNPGVGWKTGFDERTSTYDVEYVLTHEIGHALGLDHPGARGHVMAFRYLETSRQLSTGDVAGAVALYGARHTENNRHLDHSKMVKSGLSIEIR